jgi:fused signal recognition particle receptor
MSKQENKGPNPSLSLFTKLKDTSSKIVSKLNNIIYNKKIDYESLQEIEELLISADFGPIIASRFKDKLSNIKLNETISILEIKKFIAEEIYKVLKPFEKDIIFSEKKRPYVIIITGVNGSGKTTSIGKLTYFYSKSKKVSIISGDTYRAAATEQLDKVTKDQRTRFYSSPIGTDPGALIFKSLSESIKNQDDIVIIDTAGRLHNNNDLMAELEKIVRIIKKLTKDGPHSTILTIDASIGQNAYSQLSKFKDIVDINGLIITKLDGTSKGGSIIGLSEKFQTPIHYIGVGEKNTDLKQFDAKEFAYSLMDIR